MAERNSRYARLTLLPLGAALVMLGAGQASLAEPAAVAAEISDIEAAYAQGCVDCHDGTAVPKVGPLLEALGHPGVDEDTATLPGDCAYCHSEEGGMWLLSEIAHMAHYRNPAENRFVQDYGGECRHCHVMDGESGTVGVKSGPKNW
jgi:hypothetical protein